MRFNKKNIFNSKFHNEICENRKNKDFKTYFSSSHHKIASKEIF